MALKPPPVGLKKYPRLIEEWHKIKNGNLTPNDVSPSSKQKVWWRCAKGHEWPTAVENRTRGYGSVRIAPETGWQKIPVSP